MQKDSKGLNFHSRCTQEIYWKVYKLYKFQRCAILYKPACSKYNVMYQSNRDINASMRHTYMDTPGIWQLFYIPGGRNLKLMIVIGVGHFIPYGRDRGKLPQRYGQIWSHQVTATPFFATLWIEKKGLQKLCADCYKVDKKFYLPQLKHSYTTTEHNGSSKWLFQGEFISFPLDIFAMYVLGIVALPSMALTWGIWTQFLPQGMGIWPT